MRIITGSAKGIKLTTLDGDNTRPTSERAKEGIFSMLQFDIEGRSFLDLFGGSGQMALEALSRGASSATIVDRSNEAVKIIRTNAQKTRLADRCNIVCEDYAEYIRHSSGAKFDLVMLDPPYALDLIRPALRGLVDKDMLKPGSYIVCESGEEDIFGNDSELRAKFEVLKKTRYGIAYFTLLKPAEGRSV